MSNERAILCGGAPATSLRFGEKNPLRLRMYGSKPNVHLSFEDIRKPLFREIPDQFLDLIEIATYVYCADQAIVRDGDVLQGMGDDWRRKLLFRIPVRKPDLWSSELVKSILVDTLSFLSEDEYYFEFLPLVDGPAFQKYLFYADQVGNDSVPEEVVLFSGGLDSLGGAIQEAVVQKRRVALIRHKSTPKLEKRISHLCAELGKKATSTPPMHLPVSINKKDKGLNKEYTQRSRSFLYASLATTVAQMFGLSRIRFYENGVVSLNLPPSPQVVGARATRTTHPQVLNGFARLFSALAEKPFTVENPFLWKTKTEVVDLVTKAGCANLIRYATSCTHVWEMTRLNTHCGMCSQCIDRRFAVLGAGRSGDDPAEAYKVDLLTGVPDKRTKGEPKTMLAAYVETANEVSKMTPVQFFSRFGEASRILRHINGSADTVAMRVFELHQRHAKEVTKVVDGAISAHAADIRKRALPEGCLLRLVCDSSASRTPQVQVSPPPATDLPPNYIWKKGQCWAVRFHGNEEKIYTPDTGFYYLQMLLERSGTWFSSSELDCAVSRRTKETIRASVSAGEDSTDEKPSIFGKSDAGEILDKDAIQSYRLRIEEINEKLEEARGKNDLAETATLETEKQWISSELSKAHGPQGRIRKLLDERNRVRNRVCNAIRRALKKVEQYDRSLSEHLVKPVLTLGHSVCYVPRDGITWSVAATPPQGHS